MNIDENVQPQTMTIYSAKLLLFILLNICNYNNGSMDVAPARSLVRRPKRLACPQYVTSLRT